VYRCASPIPPTSAVTVTNCTTVELNGCTLARLEIASCEVGARILVNNSRIDTLVIQGQLTGVQASFEQSTIAYVQLVGVNASGTAVSFTAITFIGNQRVFRGEFLTLSNTSDLRIVGCSFTDGSCGTANRIEFLSLNTTSGSSLRIIDTQLKMPCMLNGIGKIIYFGAAVLEGGSTHSFLGNTFSNGMCSGVTAIEYASTCSTANDGRSGLVLIDNWLRSACDDVTVYALSASTMVMRELAPIGRFTGRYAAPLHPREPVDASGRLRIVDRRWTGATVWLDRNVFPGNNLLPPSLIVSNCTMGNVILALPDFSGAILGGLLADSVDVRAKGASTSLMIQQSALAWLTIRGLWLNASSWLTIADSTFRNIYIVDVQANAGSRIDILGCTFIIAFELSGITLTASSFTLENSTMKGDAGPIDRMFFTAIVANASSCITLRGNTFAAGTYLNIVHSALHVSQVSLLGGSSLVFIGNTITSSCSSLQPRGITIDTVVSSADQRDVIGWINNTVGPCLISVQLPPAAPINIMSRTAGSRTAVYFASHRRTVRCVKGVAVMEQIYADQLTVTVVVDSGSLTPAGCVLTIADCLFGSLSVNMTGLTAIRIVRTTCTIRTLPLVISSRSAVNSVSLTEVSAAGGVDMSQIAMSSGARINMSQVALDALTISPATCDNCSISIDAITVGNFIALRQMNLTSSATVVINHATFLSRGCGSNSRFVVDAVRLSGGSSIQLIDSVAVTGCPLNGVLANGVQVVRSVVSQNSTIALIGNKIQCQTECNYRFGTVNIADSTFDTSSLVVVINNTLDLAPGYRALDSSVPIYMVKIVPDSNLYGVTNPVTLPGWFSARWPLAQQPVDAADTEQLSDVAYQVAPFDISRCAALYLDRRRSLTRSRSSSDNNGSTSTASKACSATGSTTSSQTREEVSSTIMAPPPPPVTAVLSTAAPTSTTTPQAARPNATASLLRESSRTLLRVPSRTVLSHAGQLDNAVVDSRRTTIPTAFVTAATISTVASAFFQPKTASQAPRLAAYSSIAACAYYDSNVDTTDFDPPAYVEMPIQFTLGSGSHATAAGATLVTALLVSAVVTYTCFSGIHGALSTRMTRGQRRNLARVGSVAMAYFAPTVWFYAVSLTRRSTVTAESIVGFAAMISIALPTVMLGVMVTRTAPQHSQSATTPTTTRMPCSNTTCYAAKIEVTSRREESEAQFDFIAPYVDATRDVQSCAHRVYYVEDLVSASLTNAIVGLRPSGSGCLVAAACVAGIALVHIVYMTRWPPNRRLDLAFTWTNALLNLLLGLLAVVSNSGWRIGSRDPLELFDTVSFVQFSTFFAQAFVSLTWFIVLSWQRRQRSSPERDGETARTTKLLTSAPEDHAQPLLAEIPTRNPLAHAV
jgi:hypothetical protein